MINKDFSLFKIDRRSTVAFDIQLRDNITALIFSHRLIHNETLPLAETLASYLEIEISIVEKAYRSLVEERLLSVNESEAPSVSYFELASTVVSKLGSIFEALEQMGFKSSIVCLNRKQVVYKEEEAKKLSLPAGRPFLRLERVYYGDKTPFGLLIQHFPLDLIPTLNTEFKDDERSFIVLARVHPIKLDHTERKVFAVKLSKEQINILEERKKAAALLTRTQVFDVKGNIVEYTDAYVISRYFFQIQLARKDII